jgi:S-DNA-T family DNA segregation ATPase FtsK/SpoIIIE
MDIAIKSLMTNRRLNEVAGLLLIILGIAALLALLTYTAADAPFFFSHSADPGPAQNSIGRVGATMAEVFLQLFGAASFLLPFAFALIGWSRLRPAKEKGRRARIVGYFVLGCSLCALMELIFRPMSYGGAEFAPGGYFGKSLGSLLQAMLNIWGARLFTIALLVTTLVLLTRISLLRSIDILGRWSVVGGGGAIAFIRGWLDKRRRRSRAWSASRRAKEPTIADPKDAAAAGEKAARRPSIALEPAAPAAAKPAAAENDKKAKSSEATEEPSQQKLPMAKAQRGFSLPSLDLLARPEPQTRESEDQLRERAKQITEKFHEFAMDGSVVAIHPGPVVTTFEFRPDAGIKYSKITGMTDDLSLALKAESVRIERLAGRSTIGIEVPNLKQELIYPYDLLASEIFASSRSKLTLALGKDIHGEVCVAELDRMPHILIAGATGAGKSVGINGMIVSLLYKCTPDDLRFIMIDTKMIELGIYSKIPHLLVPVVTEPKKAAVALMWAVREMESRYRKLASVGVRNLAQFNALLEEEPDRTMDDPKGGDPIPLTRLPYIVIVIDELADLMMVASSDVEVSVMRLAQMARAVGIHLLLATQRPSVDVITGTIKANFPSRIAFRVSQRVDSRTIIDQQGAEGLLGRGDMLFLSAGSARVKRLHGGYITEAEINRITSFLAKMAKPVFDESVLEEPEEQRGGFEEGDKDEAYVEAVRTVINEGKCSITLIQRRLSLGYARAARIVDVMESEGIVGPGEGSKPREVLVGPEVLETLENP